MFNIIERYINLMTTDDVRKFATSKNINLNDDEINFTYDFIKKNYKNILANPKLFNLDRYKNKYSEENFNKIKMLYIEYYSKYHNFF